MKIETVPSWLSTISMSCCCCGKSMQEAVVTSQKPPPPALAWAMIVLMWVWPLNQATRFGYSWKHRHELLGVDESLVVPDDQLRLVLPASCCCDD